MAKYLSDTIDLGTNWQYGEIMKIPKFVDQLWHVTVEKKVNTLGGRKGEVKNLIDFNTDALTATTEYIILEDGSMYDLFVSDRNHYYIIVNYEIM